MYVAVYGTLRKGFHANSYLGDSHFVGTGKLYPQSLVDVVYGEGAGEDKPLLRANGGSGVVLAAPHHMGFPALVFLDNPRRRILPQYYHTVVEVYDVLDDSVMRRLDTYEGYPTLYRKAYFEVEVGEHYEVCCMYVMDVPDTTVDQMYLIKTGDWVEQGDDALKTIGSLAATTAEPAPVVKKHMPFSIDRDTLREPEYRGNDALPAFDVTGQP